jgi:hypothetical protein
MASLLGERMASLLEKCPTNRREIPLGRGLQGRFTWIPVAVVDAAVSQALALRSTSSDSTFWVEGELDFREAGITSGFDGIESRMFPGRASSSRLCSPST